jgi:hypothetical protein
LNPLKIRQKPEEKIRAAIKVFLEARGWMVEITHGNLYQAGLPDLYCAHARHGSRWVEVKNPEEYKFTAAQKKKFPVFEAHGVGIWVLTAGTEDEFLKLFKPPNWREYL